MKVADPLDKAANDAANDDGAIAYIATLLERFPPRKRRAVMHEALRVADPAVKPFPPLYMAMSTKQSPALRGAIARGAATFALNAISEIDNANATIPGVVRSASALASGVPMSGDPDGASTVSLATTLTRASGTDPALREYITDKGVDELAQSLSEIYDCHQHNYVLGGAPMSGGFWDTVSNIGAAVSRGVDTFKRLREAQTPSSDPSVAKGTYDAQVAQSTLEAASANASQQLTQLKAQLQQQAEQQKAYMTSAEQKALESTKLAWALSILDAPEEVARLLVCVQPNFTSPKEAVATAFDLVGSARASGDTNALAAFVGGLKAAVSRGKLSSDALSSLLASDPVEQLAEEGPESTAAQLRAYIDGHANDPYLQRIIPGEESARIENQIAANRGLIGNDL